MSSQRGGDWTPTDTHRESTTRRQRQRWVAGEPPDPQGSVRLPSWPQVEPSLPSPRSQASRPKTVPRTVSFAEAAPEDNTVRAQPPPAGDGGSSDTRVTQPFAALGGRGQSVRGQHDTDAPHSVCLFLFVLFLIINFKSRSFTLCIVVKKNPMCSNLPNALIVTPSLVFDPRKESGTQVAGVT